MSGQPIDAVNKFYQTYNDHNPDLWNEAMAEDYVGDVNGRRIPNRDFGRGFVNVILTAFPDIRYIMDDCMLVGDNRVVVRWRATGTHTGELMGMPPTNKNVSMIGITIFETRDGKVTKLWDVWDQAGLMNQLQG